MHSLKRFKQTAAPAANCLTRVPVGTYLLNNSLQCVIAELAKKANVIVHNVRVEHHAARFLKKRFSPLCFLLYNQYPPISTANSASLFHGVSTARRCSIRCLRRSGRRTSGQRCSATAAASSRIAPSGSSMITVVHVRCPRIAGIHARS